MTPTREHATLMRRLYEIGTMRFGDFTLKSGIKSPFYIDLRVVICFPDVLRRIGVLMAAEVSRCAGDRIAGIPYAGLPLAVSASLEGISPDPSAQGREGVRYQAAHRGDLRARRPRGADR